METRPRHARPAAFAAPGLGCYEIDARHSAITFRTRHLFGLGPVRGAFTIAAGTVNVAEPLTASGIHAEIEAASFRTGNPARDTATRSGRLLDAGRHPVITFDADSIDAASIDAARTDGTSIDGASIDGATVTGRLAVRGVTRPVRLSVESVEPEPPAAGAPAAFTVRARTRIDRTEFGITAMRGLAGRHLELTLEVRCVRK
jgi:polyisoprenoid-binding protein YceI